MRFHVKRLREVTILQVHLTFSRDLLSLEWQSEAFSLERGLIPPKAVTLHGEPYGSTNTHSQYSESPKVGEGGGKDIARKTKGQRQCPLWSGSVWEVGS